MRVGINIQIEADGCPGVTNGNELASTTRTFPTPMTRAFESITAFLSDGLPIAPKYRRHESANAHKKGERKEGEEEERLPTG